MVLKLYLTIAAVVAILYALAFLLLKQGNYLALTSPHSR